MIGKSRINSINEYRWVHWWVQVKANLYCRLNSMPRLDLLSFVDLYLQNVICDIAYNKFIYTNNLSNLKRKKVTWPFVKLKWLQFFIINSVDHYKFLSNKAYVAYRMLITFEKIITICYNKMNFFLNVALNMFVHT